MRRSILLPAIMFVCMSAPAMAEECADGARAWNCREIKFLVGAHDYQHDNDASDSVSVGVEFLFSPVTILETETPFLRQLLAPRPGVGIVANTEGDTHHAHVGLTWTFGLIEGLYIAPGFGVAVHTGNLDQPRRPCTAAELAAGCASREPVGQMNIMDGKPALGSRVVFREALEVGYAFGNGVSVGAYIIHLSHAYLFDEDDNGGMDEIGVRVGMTF